MKGKREGSSKKKHRKRKAQHAGARGRGGFYDGMNPTHARDPYRLFGWEVESNPDGANPFS